ncbi:MAG: 4-hydroxyphenylpyruvate dioxygenase [Bacteroidota bacterium]
MDTKFPIIGVGYLEFYVANARQAVHYFQSAFGFRPFAYSGPETGNTKSVSYALKQGEITLVFTAPIRATSEIAAHVHMHGDGVKCIALEVPDASLAFQHALSKGARPSMFPQKHADASGEATIAGIHAYGDTIHLLVEKKDYQGVFLPTYIDYSPVYHPDSIGIIGLDHIMSNVGWAESEFWCDFYEKALGFERKSPFDDSDISGSHSTLMARKDQKGIRLRFPVTEPIATNSSHKSRVEKFLTFYNGPGVQHIALGTNDILHTVRELYRRGVQFQHVMNRPNKQHVAALRKKIGDVQTLDDMGIMVDRDAESYLFQIFTQPITDRFTVCFEIIQRLDPGEIHSHPLHGLFEAIDAC